MRKLFKDHGLGILIFILILGLGYLEKPMAASSVRSDGVSIDQTNICDPITPNVCAQVIGGQLQTNATGSSTTSTLSMSITTNAPTYSNNTTANLSGDLNGQLRVNPGLYSAFGATSNTFQGTFHSDSMTTYASFTTVTGYQNGTGGAAYVASTTGSVTVNGSGSFAVTGIGSSTSGATVTDGTTPIFLGGCTGLSTQPTAVSTGTASRCVNTLDGSRYVRYGGPITWFAGTSADAATTVKIQSAPGSGLSLYISDVITQSNTATAGLFTLVSGTGAGNNCTTGQAAIFNNSTAALYASPANTSPVNHFHLSIPIKLPANVDLCVLGVATNTTNITVTGFTAP